MKKLLLLLLSVTIFSCSIDEEDCSSINAREYQYYQQQLEGNPTQVQKEFFLRSYLERVTAQGCSPTYAN